MSRTYWALSNAEIAWVRKQMSNSAKAAKAGATLWWGARAAAKWAAKLWGTNVWSAVKWAVKWAARLGWTASALWSAAAKAASKLMKRK